VLRDEVAAQAGESVVLSDELAISARVAIEEHPTIAAAPELRGVTGRMHEDMHVRMRLRADRSRLLYLVAGRHGADLAAPDGSGVRVDIGVAATELYDVWVDWIYCNRQIIISLTVAAVVNRQHVRDAGHRLPAAAGPVETVKSVRYAAPAPCNKSIEEVWVCGLHAKRDPAHIRCGGNPCRSFVCGTHFRLQINVLIDAPMPVSGALTLAR
jgi:hypothetical protein